MNLKILGEWLGRTNLKTKLDEIESFSCYLRQVEGS